MLDSSFHAWSRSRNVLTLGDGLERFTREQIETTTNVQAVTVMPQPVDRQDGVMVRHTNVRVISPADARDLESRIAGLAAASLRITGSSFLTISRWSVCSRRPLRKNAPRMRGRRSRHG
ncbi:MAG: hypothetical protein L0271_12335 [Gemmatimonadetes bacterium]|nr:hypothetical protein [Gemmatimonadota bacterium]